MTAAHSKITADLHRRMWPDQPGPLRTEAEFPNYTPAERRVDAIVHGGALVNHALSYSDLFAPNVILSGLAVRHRLRIRQVTVQHIGRRHGSSSLGRLNVLRPAALSLWQTWTAARRNPGALSTRH